jgi:hypothetical protein
MGNSFARQEVWRTGRHGILNDFLKEKGNKIFRELQREQLVHSNKAYRLASLKSNYVPI